MSASRDNLFVLLTDVFEGYFGSRTWPWVFLGLWAVATAGGIGWFLNSPDTTDPRGGIVQCVDGTWSHAGGRQGACSSHGGIDD